jgi:hypothetical protein
MMARTGAVESFANSAFTSLASSTSLVVSTTIDPPSPSINTELASEKPTATHTPLATVITSRRNSTEWARNFSRSANSWAAVAPQVTMSIKSPVNSTCMTKLLAAGFPVFQEVVDVPLVPVVQRLNSCLRALDPRLCRH